MGPPLPDDGGRRREVALVLVREISCGLKCEICGTATYIGQEDIVIGIKHTKGWSYRLICGRCLGDRKEFMGEYGKAANKLVRVARAGSRKWLGEDRDVPIENGHIRWGKLRRCEDDSREMNKEQKLVAECKEFNSCPGIE